MVLISLLLLGALLPYFSHSASVDVGIVNGTEARPHSRPYMVSIQTWGRHICGGFLVSDRFVMTAAHCWNRATRFTVVLGAHDLANSGGTSISMDVEDYRPHQWFNRGKMDYDIMLLKLRGTVPRSQTVNLISIPQSDVQIPANTVCSVAGWGQTGARNPQSTRLLETQITIIDDNYCRYFWPLTPRMVCALRPGGSCMGDSGGPLVCGGIAVGIVSFGDTYCEKPYRPNVYSKISAFLPWISSNMRQ